MTRGNKVRGVAWAVGVGLGLGLLGLVALATMGISAEMGQLVGTKILLPTGAGLLALLLGIALGVKTRPKGLTGRRARAAGGLTALVGVTLVGLGLVLALREPPRAELPVLEADPHSAAESLLRFLWGRDGGPRLALQELPPSEAEVYARRMVSAEPLETEDVSLEEFHLSPRWLVNGLEVYRPAERVIVVVRRVSCLECAGQARDGFVVAGLVFAAR